MRSGFAILLLTPAAFGGMPSPIPENPERILRLGDSPMMRIQTFSFFLLVFLLCALLVKVLWNYARRDVPSLPRLTFGRAIAGVFLWGLLFVIVLTMISGARELMTPGAWRKQGFTYKLVADPAPAAAEEPDAETPRREHLEKLRTALLLFASTHNGQFPNAEEVSAIATPQWEMPGTGMRYIYRPGLTAQHLPVILAYEPEIVQDRRLVLRTNGDITMMTTAAIRQAVETPP